MEKNKKFKKFLIGYVIVLAMLMIIFLCYVINSLHTYENLQVENFLCKVVSNLPDYLDVNKMQISKFEDSNVNAKNAISKYLKSADLKYTLNSESLDLTNPVYDVYANDELILHAKLNGEKKVTRLAILTFQDWKLDEITVSENGIYTCNIEAPSNFKVYVNGKQVTEKEKTEGGLDEGLTELAKYAEIPYMTKYTINNLLSTPEIKIEDENGKEIEYVQDKNTFKVGLEFKEFDNKQEASKNLKGDIDVEQVAKDWSLYLTNDLSGKLHGFYNINKYLIKNSNMWDYAYKWATNVDITFISSHILDNPTFTNVKISNFKIYNDKAFCCDVYLEKNLILNKAGNKKFQDKMNERMYFAYYDGSWRLVNMQSLSK